MAKSKPDLKCAGCGLIGSCYFNEPNQGWYCVEGCEAAKKRGTPEQVIVCEDAPGPCAACHDLTDGEVIDSADYCDSCAILVYREKLAAMQARAEDWQDRAERRQGRVEALESRLAEVAPVVEAAEALEPHLRTISVQMNGATLATVEQKGLPHAGALRNAVRAMRAARSLRGAGEGNAEARKGEEGVTP